uniref:uncharacterized protein LOC114583097 n=1 Tax=Podarcis muralis TaxID=64176 RepID=UPI0010A00E54|nr:uncharacterized protein LOC114583097 [Podarcis muralis]
MHLNDTAAFQRGQNQYFLLLKAYYSMFTFKGIHLTRQETCPTPGTLTKPNIFLETSPSDEADEVLVKCQIPPVSPFTRIILCEDGVEIKSQKQKNAIFLYKFSYKISRASTRQLSCMYQNKDKNNQVNNSSPSDAKNLYVSERGTWRTDFNEDAVNGWIDACIIFFLPLALGFGITTASILICAALFYVLEKRGIIQWRATRHPERENQTRKDMLYPLFLSLPLLSRLKHVVK